MDEVCILHPNKKRNTIPRLSQNWEFKVPAESDAKIQKHSDDLASADCPVSSRRARSFSRSPHIPTHVEPEAEAHAPMEGHAHVSVDEPSRPPPEADAHVPIEEHAHASVDVQEPITRTSPKRRHG